MVATPDAAPYVDAADESGVYLAVIVSDPAERAPAGTEMVADPSMSVAGAEV